MAAGIGSRLGRSLPKAMVKLDGHKTILDYQLENLKRIIKTEDIIVVVGYKKNLIINEHPNLSFIYNKHYMETNTSKSLLLALEKIGIDSDVLWLNGDIVFAPEILTSIIKNNNENLICVNSNPVSEEEVKYALNEDGYIKNISKNVQSAVGEAIGINFVTKKSISQLISCLQGCNNMDYFEKGLECAIRKGIKFFPLNVNEYFSEEIDFEKDLEKAIKFVKGEN